MTKTEAVKPATWAIETDRWCILRVSGAQTLALSRSLNAAGIEAWTPTRTLKRAAPGQRRRLAMGQRRVMVEVDAPVLSTFVFARAEHITALLHATSDPASAHPAFSVFHHAGIVQVVRDNQLAGLRKQEIEDALAIQRLRDADSYEARRRERAASLRTEQARRKALRAERRDFVTGTHVEMVEMPALAGLRGLVVGSDGTSATICFGGKLTMKIEAWRLTPTAVQDGNAVAA